MSNEIYEHAAQHAIAHSMGLILVSTWDGETGRWYAATARQTVDANGHPQPVSCSESFEREIDALRQAVLRAKGRV